MINESGNDGAVTPSSTTATTTSGTRSGGLGLVRIASCASGVYYDEAGDVRAAQRREADPA